MPMVFLAALGHDAMVSPAALGHDAMVSPAALGHDAMVSPAALGHDAMVSPAALGHDAMVSPAALGHDAMVSPAALGHDAMVSPAALGLHFIPAAELSVQPDLVSTPNFVVEVTKLESNKTLVLDCHYPEDEVGQGEEEEESDIFTIREVSFQPTGDTDWKENSYTLTTDSLDWALYDHLMDFLSDRGIDNTFADELIELSTALEHQEYIHFLESLNKFVKC
ncbi:complement component 1 Q subcomponent-binding protein, mitochondrial [Anomaloglossus baeobatrachus]|uniref:complement component 1 Q subcomponent-binding protein, mitochondrial n=1 Tax=Anomaloglossus baeobatrachus TaxID=238106 RepID=UPI003F5015EB